VLVIIGHDNLIWVVSADFFVLMPTPERLDLGGIGGITKLFVHPENNKLCGPAYIRISQRFYNNLRPYAGGITHRYTDDHLIGYRIVAVSFHNIV
jgi:hypothetical protein